jgi:hypothetical protein
MKSNLYKKFRAGKMRFRTHVIKGSGNAKGKLVVGSEAALQHIQQQIGRPLRVVKTDHTKFQWVFCEAR